MGHGQCQSHAARHSTQGEGSQRAQPHRRQKPGCLPRASLRDRVTEPGLSNDGQEVEAGCPICAGPSRQHWPSYSLGGFSTYPTQEPRGIPMN
jgi:hypothetical protein